MTIKIVIVEDDDVSFIVDKEIIAQYDDMEIVGHAKDKNTAITLAKTLNPDVMLVDINLTKKEDQYGVEVAIEVSIMNPAIKIIMLSGILNEDTVRSTIGIGVACNYLIKRDPMKIPNAIYQAVRGESKLGNEVISFILQDYRETLKATMMKLTSHHIKVLELFYRGYSLEQVANVLKLELQSVRNLQQEIAKRCFGWKWRFRKLNAVELAKRAKKLELF